VLVLLPALLVVAAFVVDVGYWFVTDRSAQNAADAAALAAAQELDGSAGSVAAATAKANEYITSNLPGASGADAEPRLVDIDIVTPYEGDPDKVEVVVRMRASSFFANVVRVDGVTVEARAVAQKSEQEISYAIFTGDRDCDFSLRFNASDIDINGPIHANGRIENNGNRNSAYSASSSNRCSLPSGLALDNPPHVRHPDLRLPYPQPYDVSDFCGPRPTWRSSMILRSSDPAGVYCVRGKFEANANNLNKQITVIAEEFQINGENQSFTPYQDGLLFFLTGNNGKELILDGKDGRFSGTLYNPEGRIVVDEENIVINQGFLQAEEVLVNGRRFTMNGGGGQQEDAVSALIE
jgi:hypothetical protein